MLELTTSIDALERGELMCIFSLKEHKPIFINYKFRKQNIQQQ